MANDVIVSKINAVADIDPISAQVSVSLAPIESLVIYYDVVSHGVSNSFRRTDLVADN